MEISALDIQLHDTYFVAHFHIVMGVAAFFLECLQVSTIGSLKCGDRFMNETVGQIHFWGTLIGAYMIFWPMHYLGMAGVPRKILQLRKLWRVLSF